MIKHTVWTLSARVCGVFRFCWSVLQKGSVYFTEVCSVPQLSFFFVDFKSASLLLCLKVSPVTFQRKVRFLPSLLLTTPLFSPSPSLRFISPPLSCLQWCNEIRENVLRWSLHRRSTSAFLFDGVDRNWESGWLRYIRLEEHRVIVHNVILKICKSVQIWVYLQNLRTGCLTFNKIMGKLRLFNIQF